MLFNPKSSKFKKYQKGILPNRVKYNSKFQNKNVMAIKLLSGSFGSITAKQLTAIRFIIRKFIKRKGLVHFKTFPQRSITKKPLEIRMGKGKGAFSYWCANMKYGSLICEIYCSKKYKRQIAKFLKRVQIRLPLRTHIIR